MKEKIKIVYCVFLTVLAVLLSVKVFPQQDSSLVKKVFYYPDGKVSSEGFLKNGKPDGYWKTYFSNGSLKSEGNRVNYLLDSTWNFFAENGTLMVLYTYKEGKKNGVKETYDPEQGYMLKKEHYVNDTLQGEMLEFFESGKVKRRVNFENGKEEGLAYDYNPEGIIQKITEYRYGFIKRVERINRKDKNGWKQGRWKEFYLDGTLKLDGSYLNDKRHGYFKEYDREGDLVSTTKYVKGEIEKDAPELAKVEIKRDYYANGRIKYIGGYKDSIAQGPHRQYDTLGNIVSSQIYEDGILMAEGILDAKGRQQGLWKEYHLTGELRGEGMYKDGKRIGEWVFYHPNGVIEQKGKYDDKGRAQGEWNWYYSSSNLLRKENYRNDVLDGSMVEYSDSGDVITKGEYLDGMREGEWFYQLGDYREEGTYKSDRRDGEWKHYYNSNGKVRFKGKFVDGNPDGKHVYYYSNGKTQQEGKYIMGVKEGEWEYRDELGAMYLKITYENGVEIKFDGVKVRPTQKEEDAPETSSRKK